MEGYRAEIEIADGAEGTGFERAGTDERSQWGIVLGTQKSGVEVVRSGMKGREIEKAANIDAPVFNGGDADVSKWHAVQLEVIDGRGMSEVRFESDPLMW